VNEALKSAELKENLAKVGFEPRVFSPPELIELMAEETRKWTAIVKETGFQM
jgi:tripartite-type tricarboxylate transporter receptor subunit TctC